jgi:hypothetical protein
MQFYNFINVMNHFSGSCIFHIMELHVFKVRDL